MRRIISAIAFSAATAVAPAPSEQARNQISKAGFRLAALLAELFKD